MEDKGHTLDARCPDCPGFDKNNQWGLPRFVNYVALARNIKTRRAVCASRILGSPVEVARYNPQSPKPTALRCQDSSQSPASIDVVSVSKSGLPKREEGEPAQVAFLRRISADVEERSFRMRLLGHKRHARTHLRQGSVSRAGLEVVQNSSRP